MYLRIPQKEDAELASKMYSYCRNMRGKMIERYDSLEGFNYTPFQILIKDIGGTIDEPTCKAFSSEFQDDVGIVAVTGDAKFYGSFYETCIVAEASEIISSAKDITELESGDKVATCGHAFLQITSNEELDFLSVCSPNEWEATGEKVAIAVENETGEITYATVLKNRMTNKEYIALTALDDKHLTDVDPEEINLNALESRTIILCERKPIRWIISGDYAMALDSPVISTAFDNYPSSQLSNLINSPEFQVGLGLAPTIEKPKSKNPFTVGNMTLDQQIKKALRIGVIPFLVGPPGIGKTEILESQSKHVKSYIMSTWSPTSFTGKDYVLPADVRTSVDKDGVTVTHTERALTGRAKPEWLTDIERELELAKEDGEDVILFLDEFDKLTPDLQVFVNGIISENPTIGGWPVPKGVKIVLAGNTTVDSLASNKISSEVSSRLMTIKVKPNVDEWIRWAIRNNIDPLVIAYIKNNRADLLTVEKGPDGRVDPELSMNPRKWVKMVHKGLIESRVTGEPLMINNYMTEAQVEKFMDFIDKYYDNRIDEILDGTAPLHVTDDIGHNSFVLTTLSAIARVDQLKNILPFIRNKEYRIFFLRSWLNYHPDNKTEVYEIMQEISLDEESVEHGIKI